MLKAKRTLFKSSFSLKWLLFLVVVIQVLAGLFFVFEASGQESFLAFGQPYYFVKQQSIWLSIGILLMIFTQYIPLSWWRKLSPVLYWLGFGMLVAVFIPGVGRNFNGASRWISLGFAVVQPIEFMKLALLVYFAKWLHDYPKYKSWLFLTLLPVGLVIAQPDLGSAMVLMTLAFGMYFLAGGSWKSVIFTALGGTVILTILILIAPYRMARLTSFRNPESDPLGSSFHIRQITLALGNGGLWGQGIGNSRQKFAYIPESSTDSIFAIVAEEVGFVGSSLIMALYLTYFMIAYRVARIHPPRSFPSLLAYGVLLWLSSHLLLNLASIVALVPLTGIPLPFYSYGGSALLTSLLATGLLLRVIKESES